MNKRLTCSKVWVYRNPKIGFYSLDIYFPCLILDISKEKISVNFYAWNDFWLYKSRNSFTISFNFLGFGLKFHHRNKESEYGIKNHH